MSNQQPSGRRAKYLPPDSQIGSTDSHGTWNPNLNPCEFCGEPNHLEPGQAVLTDQVCPGCGKNPWRNSAFFLLAFILYWAAVIIWLLGGGFDLWPLPNGFLMVLCVAGGFVIYILIFGCFSWCRARILKRRIRRKIATLEVLRAQNPGDVELLGKISTLYSFLWEWKATLSLAEQALLFDPENTLIKARVKYASEAVKNPAKVAKDLWNSA